MARILIVDDSPTLMGVLKDALEQSGHIISGTGDGMAGLEFARKELPDLIILDLMLPKLDGYKVAKLLKLDQRCKNVKILMLTSKAGENDRKLGMESGADDYLTKDMGIDKVVERVNTLLKK